MKRVKPMHTISPLTVGFGLDSLILEFKVTLYYGCFTQVVLTAPFTHTQMHTPSTWLLWQISTFQLLVSFVLAPDLGSHQPDTHQGLLYLTAVLQWAYGIG